LYSGRTTVPSSWPIYDLRKGPRPTSPGGSLNEKEEPGAPGITLDKTICESLIQVFPPSLTLIPPKTYSKAFQKSLETKKYLQKTLLTTQYRSILTDDLATLDGEKFVKIIDQESKAYNAKQEKKSKWRGRVSDSATALSRLTVNLSSYIDPLIPQSPEYKVPYACLMIIFKASACDECFSI